MMYDFKNDKEREDKEKVRNGALLFMGFGIIIIMIGIMIIIPAFAFNQTAIDELQAEFAEETTYEGTFPFFYIVFLIVILAGFMVAMFVYREDRETVFFSLSSLIVALILTLMFTSPLIFDIQEHENSLIINANNTDITSITVIQQTNQMEIIPYDSGLRMATSLLFTGLTIFLALYSMYIITNYHEGTRLNPKRG